MGHSIIISLEEYNSLIKMKEDFKTAFDKGKNIIFHDSYFTGSYPVHKFTVVNNNEFIKDLQDKITRIEGEKSNLWEENNTLKENLNKKKCWFNFG